MIDTTTVVAPTSGASAGMTSGATCGLTATITAATSPIRSRGGLRRTPRSASAVRSPAGAGSMTTIFLGASPSASQPSSIAPPILPAPTSRIVPDRSARGRALCVVEADAAMVVLSSSPAKRTIQ